MKIAFTTNDRIHINAHFGSARTIDVYEVSTDGYQFIETIDFSGNLEEDGNEDKLLPKIEALYDCTIVYVSSIGGSAAARLIKKQITPIKSRSEDEEVTDVLTRLVETLKGSPPPWLRKALQQKKTAFDDLETEEEVFA
jgi:nitrogen fixation protein NifX